MRASLRLSILVVCSAIGVHWISLSGPDTFLSWKWRILKEMQGFDFKVKTQQKQTEKKKNPTTFSFVKQINPQTNNLLLPRLHSFTTRATNGGTKPDRPSTTDRPSSTSLVKEHRGRKVDSSFTAADSSSFSSLWSFDLLEIFFTSLFGYSSPRSFTFSSFIPTTVYSFSELALWLSVECSRTLSSSVFFLILLLDALGSFLFCLATFTYLVLRSLLLPYVFLPLFSLIRQLWVTLSWTQRGVLFLVAFLSGTLFRVRPLWFKLLLASNPFSLHGGVLVTYLLLRLAHVYHLLLLLVVSSASDSSSSSSSSYLIKILPPFLIPSATLIQLLWLALDRLTDACLRSPRLPVLFALFLLTFYLTPKRNSTTTFQFSTPFSSLLAVFGGVTTTTTTEDSTTAMTRSSSSPQLLNDQDDEHDPCHLPPSVSAPDSPTRTSGYVNTMMTTTPFVIDYGYPYHLLRLQLIMQAVLDLLLFQLLYAIFQPSFISFPDSSSFSSYIDAPLVLPSFDIPFLPSFLSSTISFLVSPLRFLLSTIQSLAHRHSTSLTWFLVKYVWLELPRSLSHLITLFLVLELLKACWIPNFFRALNEQGNHTGRRRRSEITLPDVVKPAGPFASTSNWSRAVLLACLDTPHRWIFRQSLYELPLLPSPTSSSSFSWQTLFKAPKQKRQRRGEAEQFFAHYDDPAWQPCVAVGFLGKLGGTGWLWRIKDYTQRVLGGGLWWMDIKLEHAFKRARHHSTREGEGAFVHHMLRVLVLMKRKIKIWGFQNVLALVFIWMVPRVIVKRFVCYVLYVRPVFEILRFLSLFLHKHYFYLYPSFLHLKATALLDKSLMTDSKVSLGTTASHSSSLSHSSAFHSTSPVVPTSTPSSRLRASLESDVENANLLLLHFLVFVWPVPPSSLAKGAVGRLLDWVPLSWHVLVVAVLVGKPLLHRLAPVDNVFHSFLEETRKNGWGT